MDEIGRLSQKISRLEQENSELTNKLHELNTEKEQLEADLLETKQEANDYHWELDVAQIEIQKQIDNYNNLEQMLLDRNIKIHKLETDMLEADKTTTKRLSRIIEKLELYQKNYDILKKEFKILEKDIELIHKLCPGCKRGIITMTCSKCNESICRRCYEKNDFCVLCKEKFNDRNDNIETDGGDV